MSGSPAAIVRTTGSQVSAETFNSDFMGPLQASEDLYATEAHVFAPYGWGLDWKCGKDACACDVIGSIGAGYTGEKGTVCDPRTGKQISIAIYNATYGHVAPTPAQVQEIENLCIIDPDNQQSAKNGFGPWLLTEDFYAQTGCCGTTGNCNAGLGGCKSSECGQCSCNNNRYVPKTFNILITRINISNPYLTNNSSYSWAFTINGIQNRTIILERGVRYYFFNKVSVYGVDNCDILNNSDFGSTFLCFSRQPQSMAYNNIPIIQDTVPMPVDEAFWLRVPLSWPQQAYLVATNPAIAGTSVITLSASLRGSQIP